MHVHMYMCVCACMCVYVCVLACVRVSVCVCASMCVDVLQNVKVIPNQLGYYCFLEQETSLTKLQCTQLLNGRPVVHLTALTILYNGEILHA